MLSAQVGVDTCRVAGLEIVEMTIPPMAPVIGKKLGELKLPPRCTITLIIRGDLIIPTPETELHEDDEVHAIVGREGEQELRRIFGTE